MKNTDTREVIMISIRLSDKNLQADYYPFILEPEARHLFLKELASHFAARTDLLDIQQHLDEILLTLDGQQTESYTFALTLPRLISITLDTCNACGKISSGFAACLPVSQWMPAFPALSAFSSQTRSHPSFNGQAFMLTESPLLPKKWPPAIPLPA